MFWRFRSFEYGRCLITESPLWGSQISNLQILTARWYFLEFCKHRNELFRLQCLQDSGLACWLQLLEFPIWHQFLSCRRQAVSQRRKAALQEKPQPSFAPFHSYLLQFPQGSDINRFQPHHCQSQCCVWQATPKYCTASFLSEDFLHSWEVWGVST